VVEPASFLIEILWEVPGISDCEKRSLKLVGVGLRAGTFCAYKSISSARQGPRISVRGRLWAPPVFLDCGLCQRSILLATVVYLFAFKR